MRNLQQKTQRKDDRVSMMEAVSNDHDKEFMQWYNKKDSEGK